ncbi:MAG TPA: acyl-CoA dehydrogenase family protein [Candidatus Deferrimicrobium sp.]|nr:acyl-CoA dehydrogenase family protein [Candidatus Deferrimicrobium sp.]
MVKYTVQVLSDEILKKLSLKNRYSFLNTNLQQILTDDEFAFLKEVQKFCQKFEKEHNVTHGMDEDVYAWIPAFGEKGYVTRGHKFEEIGMDFGKNWGLTMDMMRAFAVDQFDPQFNMAMGASTLAINPLAEHHENMDNRLGALKDLVTGKAPGCILITEPERGSDATHMLTHCVENPDGSFTLNGTKIFNTNAPKSKWAVAYATSEVNNWEKMGQFLIDTSWSGWTCERVGIPWVDKIWIGKEELKDLRVPKEYVLGGIGKGREHLFEGLVPERIGIAIICCAQAWNALAHGVIYANMRKQFDKPILTFQGVGHLLAELWSHTTNLTLAVLCFSREYDRKYEKFGGKIPAGVTQVMVASASQMKYQAAVLSEKVCYEVANVMGGAGVCDNTLMHDLLGISRIQEVVGGTRQIQQYILSMAARQMFKML